MVSMVVKRAIMIRFTMVCKDDREQAHTTLGLKREVTDEDHDDDASNVNW